MAVLGWTLPPILTGWVEACGGAVVTAPYSRPGTDEMADITAEALADRGACFLRHHGLLAIGADLHHAYQAASVTEGACAGVPSGPPVRAGARAAGGGGPLDRRRVAGAVGRPRRPRRELNRRRAAARLGHREPRLEAGGGIAADRGRHRIVGPQGRARGSGSAACSPLPSSRTRCTARTRAGRRTTPSDWFEAVVDGGPRHPGRRRVRGADAAGLCVVGQRDPVGPRGRRGSRAHARDPLDRPARPRRARRRSSSTSGAARIIEISGVPPTPGLVLPNLDWTRRHLPDAWRAVPPRAPAQGLRPHRLTGDSRTDTSSLSRSLLNDWRDRRLVGRAVRGGRDPDRRSCRRSAIGSWEAVGSAAAGRGGRTRTCGRARVVAAGRR